MCQGKNYFKSGGIFYSLFLAPKIKYCLTIDEYEIIKKHKTFKGFNDSNRLIKRNQFFEMRNGNKISSIVPLSWKKSFNTGVVIPNKARFFSICQGNMICNTCNNQINQAKDYKLNINELKRLPPNRLGHMLLYYKIN